MKESLKDKATIMYAWQKEDLYWSYKGLIGFMEKHPPMYGLDNRRVELHKKLEKVFCGKEAELKVVLHDLPSGYSYNDFVWAVYNIEKFKQRRVERET